MSKADLKKVGYLYMLNKLLIVFMVWLTRDVLGTIFPAKVDNKHPNVLLDSLIHWDAGWFLRIAGQGYDFDSAPFFPMFPFLIRLLTYITDNAVVAGFLIANVSLFIASYLFYSLVKEDYGEEIASTSVLVMLFFPTAIFYSSIYSEAPFMAFCLGAFYYARRRRWLPAVLLGACAALTRNAGVVLFAAFLFMQYRDNGYKLDIKKALPLFIIPASLSIFMYVLWKATGDPLAFANSLNREYWGFRHFAYPGAGQITNLTLFFRDNNFYALFESGMALIFLFLIFQSFKYIKDRAFLIFLVLGFLIPFSSVVDNLPLGMPRYIIVLFPGFITLSILLHRHGLVHIYSILTVLAFSVISILFVIGRWIS